MKRSTARVILSAATITYFVVGGSWLAFVVLAPPLDNILGIRTGQDLASFRNLSLAGKPVEAVLLARSGRCSWHAAHGEYFSATVVTCTPPSGTALSWEVSHYSPRPSLALASLYFTPLNRAAAAALPELLPSRMRPEDLPLSRYASGVVYDLSNGGFSSAIVR